MTEMTDCLDVACGDIPQGTCNLDVNVDGVTIQRNEGPVHLALTPNFVKGECCHLPFRTGTFEMVRCTHTIEHLDDPVALIREMARVSKHHMMVICPFKYGLYAAMGPFSKLRKRGIHKNTFDCEWFEKVYAKLGLIRIRVDVTRWRYIPSRYLPWVSCAEEITAKAQVIHDD